MLYLETRFRRAYGADVWRAAEYRTSDGIIPFGLFWLYLRELDAHEAAERLSQVRALGVAIERAFAKEGSGHPQALIADLRRSYADVEA